METKIPSTLAPFFQEYRFESLDAARDWELVVERTLAWGNRAELSWMFSQYGRERVTDWVKRRGAARLPRRQFAGWKVILEIPVNEAIDAPCEVIDEQRGVWPHGTLRKGLP